MSRILLATLLVSASIGHAETRTVKMTADEFAAAMTLMRFNDTQIRLDNNRYTFTPSPGFSLLGVLPAQDRVESDPVDPTAKVTDMNAVSVTAHLNGDHVEMEVAYEEEGVEVKSLLGTVNIEKPIVQIEVVAQDDGAEKVFAPRSILFSGNVVPHGFLGLGHSYIKRKVIELGNKNAKKYIGAIYASSHTREALKKALTIWAQFTTGIPTVELDPGSLAIQDSTITYTVH